MLLISLSTCIKPATACVYVHLVPPPPMSQHELSICTIMKEQTSNKLGSPPHSHYIVVMFE